MRSSILIFEQVSFSQVGGTLRNEFYLVRSEVQNRMALVSLSNALKNGSASGIIGELDCSTVVTSELEESILFTKSIIQQKERELQKYNERQIVVSIQSERCSAKCSL